MKKKCLRPISFPTGMSIKDVGRFWSFLTLPLSKLPTSFMDSSYRKFQVSNKVQYSLKFSSYDLQISYSTGKLWLKTGIRSKWNRPTFWNSFFMIVQKNRMGFLKNWKSASFPLQDSQMPLASVFSLTCWTMRKN